MFDRVTLTHDEIVEWLLNVRTRINQRTVSNAFIATLTALGGIGAALQVEQKRARGDAARPLTLRHRGRRRTSRLLLRLRTRNGAARSADVHWWRGSDGGSRKALAYHFPELAAASRLRH
jgi:hypothetical protein